MTDTNVIDHLTAKFGTQIKLAKAAGVAQNTISDKKAANRLSHEQMRSILRKAPEMGVVVTPDDFFPEFQPEDEPATAEAAA